jgi:fatty acid kinase
VVVEGGQGANPSTEDLARAVKNSGAQSVILLPNSENVVPVAQKVGELVHEAEVYMVPTTNIACGLATMVGYDAEEEPEAVVEEMHEICEELWCAEITVAIRDAWVEGREVQKGAYLGILNGKLHTVDASVHTAALALTRMVVEEGADVVTLLRGEDLGKVEAERIAEDIRGLSSDLVVEVKYGGQPLYPLQMAAE